LLDTHGPYPAWKLSSSAGASLATPRPCSTQGCPLLWFFPQLVGVGRELKIIGSNPPAKAGSLEQDAQAGIQTGLEYLQRRRLHNLAGHRWSFSEGRGSRVQAFPDLIPGYKAKQFLN